MDRISECNVYGRVGVLGLIWGRIVTVQIGNLQVSLVTHDIELKIKAGGTKAKSKATTAEIGLWNLNDSYINLIKKGAIIEVVAGYEGGASPIFYGSVDGMDTEPVGADTKSTVFATDATKDLQKVEQCGFVFTANIPVATAISTVLGKTTVSPGTITGTGLRFEKDETFFGTPDEIIKALVDYENGILLRDRVISNVSMGVRFYVENNMGYYLLYNCCEAEAVLISNATGLLKVSRIKKANAADTATSAGGSDSEGDAAPAGDYKILTYLNPGIKVGSLISVDSATVKDNFRVVGYVHTVNGDEFNTEITAVAL